MATKLMKDDKIEATKSFLSFKLAEEHFAIEVMKIMEILEVPKITKVPHAPDFLKGVVNLRGGVLPVIDARTKFGMQSIDMTVDTCILVLSIELNEETITVGALVDSVSEVFEMEEKHIQPSPSIGSKYNADFIQGMIKEKDQFMMLLDIDKVFSSEELEAIIEPKVETTLA
ncbi:chemotaxis protein CheW [Aurantibacillus circumpalustris]|uniref:chemotaxis protein CheW n=1 Tax=Aurantibacillus circumpalustris TaxID=3036359 RepID=UPI00295AFB09|nr:chemotaxis protein CheW [Aurantibacillus circumpalustris]